MEKMQQINSWKCIKIRFYFEQFGGTEPSANACKLFNSFVRPTNQEVDSFTNCSCLRVIPTSSNGSSLRSVDDASNGSLLFCRFSSEKVSVMRSLKNFLTFSTKLSYPLNLT